MVNAGRVCCIAAPFLLTLAVLICMVLVFLAGTYDRNSTVDDLYFLKVRSRRRHCILWVRIAYNSCSDRPHKPDPYLIRKPPRLYRHHSSGRRPRNGEAVPRHERFLYDLPALLLFVERQRHIRKLHRPDILLLVQSCQRLGPQ